MYNKVAKSHSCYYALESGETMLLYALAATSSVLLLGAALAPFAARAARAAYYYSG